MDEETYVKAGLEKISRFNKYLPIGISFNENFLPRIVDSLSDGDSKYLKKLSRMLCEAQQKLSYKGDGGVVKAT